MFINNFNNIFIFLKYEFPPRDKYCSLAWCSCSLEHFLLLKSLYYRFIYCMYKIYKEVCCECDYYILYIIDLFIVFIKCIKKSGAISILAKVPGVVRGILETLWNFEEKFLIFWLVNHPIPFGPAVCYS